MVAHHRSEESQKEDCVTLTFSQEPIPSICSELSSSLPAASPPFREPSSCTLKICASHDVDVIPQYSSRTRPQNSPSSLLSLSVLFVPTLSPSALLSAPCCVSYFYGKDHALHVAKCQVPIPVLILMLSECLTALLPRATPSVIHPPAIPTSVHPPSATVLSICSSLQYPSTFCQAHLKKTNKLNFLKMVRVTKKF